MPRQFAQQILGNILDDMMDWTNQSSSALIEGIAPIAVSLLTIYVLWWGAAVASGRSRELISDGIYRILKLCAIVMFGLTVGTYQSEIVDLAVRAPTDLAGYVANVKAEGIPQLIDDAAEKGFSAGDTIWNYAASKFGIFNLSYIIDYLVAIVIYICVSIIIGIAIAIVFMSFISLSITLALGPLFIMLAIFPATMRYFDAWLGQAVNFIVLVVLVVCCMSLCFGIFTKVVESAISDNSGKHYIQLMLVILVLSVAMIAALLQTRAIASAIAGGVSMTSQNIVSRLMQNPMTRAASTATRAIVGGATRATGTATGSGGAARTSAPATGRARATAPRNPA